MNLITGFVYGLISLVYLVIGSVLLVKLKAFYECFSQPVVQFIVFSLIFVGVSTTRMVVFNYRYFTGVSLNQNVFTTLCYAIPDFLPVLVYDFVQIRFLIGNKCQSKTKII